jgi:hypothetical protein
VKKGDVVKYRECLEAGDDLSRFVVVEVNGDRCVVVEIAVHADMAIKPSFLRMVDEFEAA